MSPLRIEVSGENKYTLLGGGKELPGGVELRVYGSNNEIFIPNIKDITFRSNSDINVRPYNATINRILLKKGEMVWKHEDLIYRVWAVNYYDVRIR